MEELNSQYEREEDEVLSEIAPRYNMTLEEIKSFMLENMDGAIERDRQGLEVAQKENKEFLDKYRISVGTSAQEFIEETFEKQKLAGFAPSTGFKVVIYSDDPTHDKDGNVYPYSFLVSGRYEEKGSGALKDFFMTVAYKNEEDIKNYKAFCLQYINQDTDKFFSVINEEEDIFLKLQKTLTETEQK